MTPAALRRALTTLPRLVPLLNARYGARIRKNTSRWAFFWSPLFQVTQDGIARRAPQRQLRVHSRLGVVHVKDFMSPVNIAVPPVLRGVHEQA
jgi:hypothetical protein